MQPELAQASYVQDDAPALPWENLHLEFHRAIRKRLVQRGQLHLMPEVTAIVDLNQLDRILEALLEGRNLATLHTLLPRHHPSAL